jgi:hypothetical protein
LVSARQGAAFGLIATVPASAAKTYWLTIESRKYTQRYCPENDAENCALTTEVPVNQSVAHVELIAAFRRAQADAAHKSGLIQALEKKGPKAIQAAIETANKAAKRRDSFARKLHALGVVLGD